MKFNLKKNVSYFKKRKVCFITFLVTILIITDQISKHLIIKFQPDYNFLIFNISFVKNTGAAFGILQNNSFVLGLFSLIVAIILIYSIIKLKEFSLKIIISLLLAGTIGNMIDRLFRNYVIDFIGTSFWPSFNIADSLISISGVLIIIYLIKEEIDKKKK